MACASKPDDQVREGKNMCPFLCPRLQAAVVTIHNMDNAARVKVKGVVCLQVSRKFVSALVSEDIAAMSTCRSGRWGLIADNPCEGILSRNVDAEDLQLQTIEVWRLFQFHAPEIAITIRGMLLKEIAGTTIVRASAHNRQKRRRQGSVFWPFPIVPHQISEVVIVVGCAMARFAMARFAKAGLSIVDMLD
ncbi:hypothetical protein BGW80DRAFT_1449270 [Lactifluus volemus]|nr:hypothetical protein BGW80DRAFT_1449270 [Lactifluus volemus]